MNHVLTRASEIPTVAHPDRHRTGSRVGRKKESHTCISHDGQLCKLRCNAKLLSFRITHLYIVIYSAQVFRPVSERSSMRKILLILCSVCAIGNSFGADIQITSLPFNITAPGTYVLVGNLTCPANEIAIKNQYIRARTGYSRPGWVYDFCIS
jgi:hypothetical protein